VALSVSHSGRLRRPAVALGAAAISSSSSCRWCSSCPSWLHRRWNPAAVLRAFRRRLR